MKIYTKTGDDGTTGLIGGQRVAKSHLRIECYGTVDELNASLGLAEHVVEPIVKPDIFKIQNELFIIGSHLAAPDDNTARTLPSLPADAIGRLEKQMDEVEAVLPALRNFILPGGSESAARLHLARTICRRAERCMVRLAHEEPVHVDILTYINRLGDWLFVEARYANHRAGVPDTIWK